MIYPYFNYGIIIWGSNYPTRLSQLVILQKKAIRFVLNLPFKSHVSHLFIVYKFLSISQIVKLKVLCFMHRHFHNMFPSIVNNYFNLSTSHYSSRTPYCYRIPHIRTNYAKFSIKYYGPFLWNQIPLDLKIINSLPMFKNKTKEYILLNVIFNE